MEEHFVKILEIERLTHNVRRYRVERPEGYNFIPGQATEVAIDQPRWKEERRPFTFTSLPQDPYLEFSIKSYRERNGVTNALDTIQPGERLILHDVWGTIHYEDKGLFIAGGAGVTPFISIFRYLKSTDRITGNRLLFANKSVRDVIIEPEWRSVLGKDFHSILSQEKATGHDYGHVSAEIIKPLLDLKHDFVYVCGPDPFVQTVRDFLSKLNFEEKRIVREL